MKKLILLLVLPLFLFTCNNNDDDDDNDTPTDNTTTIVGTWKLTGIYLDPGDGSGTFENVTSERTITFNSDGTFSSNGFLCDLTASSDTSVSGPYSTSNSSIDVSACSFVPLSLNYTIENTLLIINYQCIEACQTRYEKL